MRKNDLIKMLQGINGNPEVLLWNGMVGDWMSIGSVQKSYLTRSTKNYWLESVQAEDRISRRDWEYNLPQDEIVELKKKYNKVCQWEDNPFITSEDVKQKRYKTKAVLYIQPKKRGVSTFDRLGNISY